MPRSDEDLAKKRLSRSMAVFPMVLEGVYFSKIEKDSFFEEKPISPVAIFRFFADFMEAPRNIPQSNFVYTGAAPYRAAQGESSEKTPRWQPRGHDTQFFRPLVQEEEVSSPGSLPVRPVRVNLILPRQLAIG